MHIRFGNVTHYIYFLPAYSIYFLPLLSSTYLDTLASQKQTTLSPLAWLVCLVLFKGVDEEV